MKPDMIHEGKMFDFKTWASANVKPVDSSTWTGRDSTLRHRIGFKGKNQLPLFMYWREMWNEDGTDVEHAIADIVIRWDQIDWFGKVFYPFEWLRIFKSGVKSYRIGALRWWWMTNHPMSRCRSCGSSKDVAFYDPRGIWAYFFRNTLCPKCCTEHEFEYDRDMREHCCTKCGEPAPFDYHAYDEY